MYFKDEKLDPLKENKVGRAIVHQKYPKQECVTAIRLGQQLVGYFKKLNIKKNIALASFQWIKVCAPTTNYKQTFEHIPI